ncbi:MAG: IS110 family transposase, partial [Planctomycetota bacterium]
MPESRRLAWTEVTFGDVATKRANLRHLLEQVRPDRVVIEICPLAGWVYDLACEMAIAIQVADPTQDAWKWKSVKRKTDEDDALKLARLSALGQLNLVHMPSPKMRQWRRLVEQRHTLVAERTRCKNRIRAVLLQEERHLPPVQWGWSLTKREELRGLARPLVECESRELWRGLLHIELRHLEQIDGLVAEAEAIGLHLLPEPVVLGLEPHSGDPAVDRPTAGVGHGVLAQRDDVQHCGPDTSGPTARKVDSGRMLV